MHFGPEHPLERVDIFYPQPVPIHYFPMPFEIPLTGQMKDARERLLPVLFGLGNNLAQAIQVADIHGLIHKIGAGSFKPAVIPDTPGQYWIPMRAFGPFVFIWQRRPANKQQLGLVLATQAFTEMRPDTPQASGDQVQSGFDDRRWLYRLGENVDLGERRL